MELLKPMRIKHILITEEGVQYAEQTGNQPTEEMFIEATAIITAFSGLEDMGDGITRIYSYNTIFDCDVPLDKMINHFNKYLPHDKQIEKNIE